MRKIEGTYTIFVMKYEISDCDCSWTNQDKSNCGNDDNSYCWAVCCDASYVPGFEYLSHMHKYYCSIIKVPRFFSNVFYVKPQIF